MLCVYELLSKPLTNFALLINNIGHVPGSGKKETLRSLWLIAAKCRDRVGQTGKRATWTGRQPLARPRLPRPQACVPPPHAGAALGLRRGRAGGAGGAETALGG